jgi:hypothetical protein
MFNIPDAPIPTEEQALDFLTEKLRAGEPVGKNNYEVYVWEVADRYVRTHVTAPHGFGIQDKVEKVISPFFSAAWALCRLGVLRPGPKPGTSMLSQPYHD